jgi:phosphoribosylformylglycinamidine synthase
MLLTVPGENVQNAFKIFEREDVEATVIGKLTEDKVLRLHYRDEIVAEVDMTFLFRPPLTTLVAEHTSITLEEPELPEPKNLTETLLQLLSSSNIASRENVVRTYDHEVKGNTVLKPLQGRHNGPNDAAVLKPLDDSWKGIAISCGINPNYGKIDTYWMAASAIDEAVRNNIAVGGRRIALLDNFAWGNPERPERLGNLVKACQACYDTAVAFETPFISGKDSLYNESPLGPVTPTLLITALGIVPDIRSTISMDIKTPNDLLYLVGSTFRELGGSEYYKLKGLLGKTVPKVQFTQAHKTFDALVRATDSGLVKACHDLSEGGLGIAAAEMAIAGGYGIELDLKDVPTKSLNRDDYLLFSESNSRFLVEVAEKASEEFELLMKKRNFAEIGRVTKTPRFQVCGLGDRTVIDVSLDVLLKNWTQFGDIGCEG